MSHAIPCLFILAALSAATASASTSPALQTPLADYSRADLGGCAEVIYSPDLQRTELYCPGAAGYQVTMTVSKYRENIFLLKDSRKLELAQGTAPTPVVPTASNLGFSGSQGIQNLALRWKLSFTTDGKQLTQTALLGLAMPISFSYATAPGQFALADYWAIIRVDESAGRACVVQYVPSALADSQAQADEAAAAASGRDCLH